MNSTAWFHFSKIFTRQKWQFFLTLENPVGMQVHSFSSAKSYCTVGTTQEVSLEWFRVKIKPLP